MPLLEMPTFELLQVPGRPNLLKDFDGVGYAVSVRYELSEGLQFASKSR